jgi:glycosyltransferase involved in cell wall biosynthesis
MRIAHLITRMIVGGAQENTLFNCLDLMHDFGDEVLLITGPTSGPEGRLLGQGRADGLPVQTIDSLRRELNPVQDLRALQHIKNEIIHFKPDVVHTHSAKAGVLGRAAAWSLNVPAVIHTVHGAPFHPYQSIVARKLYQACEKWAARRCHHMISVADAMTDLMVKGGVAPREKFTTIYSGMDVQPFLDSEQHRDAMRRQLRFDANHVVIGKIARLFELKGHEYLIAAAKEVVQVQPNVRFLLVGDGILRASLSSQIERLGLTKFFHFTGLVPPEEIPRYLSAMDMLVHTSLREGLARTLPQALIAAKPVISYDIDGAREVCLDNQTGILLPPKSIEPLAEAMIRLASQPSLRNDWGRAGRARFSERFEHRFMTARVREVYGSVLAKKSG